MDSPTRKNQLKQELIEDTNKSNKTSDSCSNSTSSSPSSLSSSSLLSNSHSKSARETYQNSQFQSLNDNNLINFNNIRQQQQSMTFDQSNLNCDQTSNQNCKLNQYNFGQEQSGKFSCEQYRELLIQENQNTINNSNDYLHQSSSPLPHPHHLLILPLIHL